jgi:dihydroxy-acid dehydratase
MGTASTMACIAEALGMTMPAGLAAGRHRRPDPHRRRERAQAVQMARDKLTIDKILTPAAFENAMRVLLAIGGSTNGIVHLTAIAGRMGLEVDLEALDRMGRETPVLLDLKPSGQHYMEDFHKAGGMATLLRELKPLLRLEALTVTGRTSARSSSVPAPASPRTWANDRRADLSAGGIAVLRGNLAPGGAIIKQSAADAALMEHEGRAVVFESLEDLAARIDSDALDVRADDVLVLKNIGPKGAPGMPEAGYIPIPRKLARAGVKDMVRISDGRMSGTAFGTIVLVTPESAVGGPLAWVQDGDRSASASRHGRSAAVSDEELAARRRDAGAGRPHRLGEVTAPDFAARGRDEIGLLANALSRMRRSLVQAISMLEA